MKNSTPIGLKLLERSIPPLENKTDYQQLIVTGSVTFLGFLLIVGAFGQPAANNKIKDIKVPVYTVEQVKARKRAELAKAKEVKHLAESEPVVSPQSEKINNFTKREAIAIVGELIKKGIVLELNPGSNDAMVNTQYWELLDFRAKEGIAYVLGAYLAFERGGGTDLVNIIDGKTGKRIAEKRYDGFKTL